MTDDTSSVAIFYLKNCPGFISGFLYRMEMPRFMKGLVKSITCSLNRKKSYVLL